MTSTMNTFDENEFINLISTNCDCNNKINDYIDFEYLYDKPPTFKFYVIKKYVGSFNYAVKLYQTINLHQLAVNVLVANFYTDIQSGILKKPMFIE